MCGPPSLSLARAPITPSTPAVGPGTGGEHDLFLSLSAIFFLSRLLFRSTQFAKMIVLTLGHDWEVELHHKDWSEKTAVGQDISQTASG